MVTSKKLFRHASSNCCPSHTGKGTSGSTAVNTTLGALQGAPPVLGSLCVETSSSRPPRQAHGPGRSTVGRELKLGQAAPAWGCSSLRNEDTQAATAARKPRGWGQSAWWPLGLWSPCSGYWISRLNLGPWEFTFFGCLYSMLPMERWLSG